MFQVLLAFMLSLALMGHFILSSLNIPGAKIRSILVDQFIHKLAKLTYVSYFIFGFGCLAIFLLTIFN